MGQRGPKKGAIYKPTRDKAALRERVRELVADHIDPMTLAQIANAKGIDYMLIRHEDGTFARATDIEQIDRALATGGEAFRIFTQQPNVQAFTDLMNRTLDKPKDQEQDVNLRVSGDLLAKIDAARKRVAK